MFAIFDGIGQNKKKELEQQTQRHIINRTVDEYIDFIGYDPITLEIFRSPEIDLENSKTVGSEMFANTMLKIAKDSGYDIIDVDLIVNDPHTRKRYDV